MSVSATQSSPWYAFVFSLRWRLAIVYSALFGIFVVLLSILLYSSTSNLLLHTAEVAFPTRAHSLRVLLTQEICSSTSPQSPMSFIQQNMPDDVDLVFLLDQNGKVIASSNNTLLQQPFPYVNSTYFTHAPANVNDTFTITTSPTNATDDGLLLSLQPLKNCPSAQLLPAYIALTTSYKNEQSTLNTILLMLGVISTVMVILGALFIAFFTGVVFKPLDQVTRATRALARGDLERRVPLSHSKDEIAELAASFNLMADRIQQMFAAQQASEQRAQRFVSDASHELRTPITSLRGFTEVLIRGAKDDPATVQHVLNLMKNEAIRMTDLVNNLLTLARLDEGNVATPTTIDLVAIAIESLQQAKKQAPDECKIALELATHDRLTIHANGELIKQMLLALLTNALVYGCSGTQKRAVLRLNKVEHHIQIQVIDHGEGIAEIDLPHVFERFYRGKNALERSTRVPGTGLGLSIAQAIAQAYQGTITVCSNPGKETIFTVAFPGS